MSDKNLIVQLRAEIGDMCVFLSSIHEIIKKENKNFVLLTKKEPKSNALNNANFFI